MKVCSLEWCDRPVTGRRYQGMCGAHESRHYKGLDLRPPIRPQGTGGSRTASTWACSQCERVLPKSEFNLRKDGRVTESKCKECRSFAAVARRYGVTRDEWLALYSLQHGACGICGAPFAGPRPNKDVVVDHCHSTGSVRGLLCNGCNTGLGYFESKSGFTEQAVRRYLAGR